MATRTLQDPKFIQQMFTGHLLVPDLALGAGDGGVSQEDHASAVWVLLGGAGER